MFRELEMYITTINGRISNETKFPVNCTFTPTVGDGPAAEATMVTNQPYISDLLPGSSTTFEQKNEVSSVNLTNRTLAWRAECDVEFQYTFASPTVEQKFAGGSVSAVVGEKEIEFVVYNNSDQPIEILWNDSSLVGIDRTAGRIFHNGVKYADREQSLPNTTVPPQAKVEDAAVPTQNVRFAESYGWTTQPLLPFRAGVEKAEAIMIALKGRKIVLFLQVLIAGKKVPVSLPFEIADVLAK
jgi:hypothetical protein